MVNAIKQIRGIKRMGLGILLLFLNHANVLAQHQVIVNLAAVDGIDLTPENIFNFHVQSLYPGTTKALLKGSIRYKNSDYRISWSFEKTLQPGSNIFSKDAVSPKWEFSSAALKELFIDYKILPQGTYEYCVTVLPEYSHGEGNETDLAEECLYKQSEDLFLINLIEPENNAKIYEYYPMLSWVANYSFSSQLNYRIRVAEVKEKQNNANAIARNNPVYDERNVMQPSIVYPVYAKPLKKDQPYAWTVDAYYRGILLGGAEPWRFTIIEDSEFVEVPKYQPYYEFAQHYGETTLPAVGELKLKYVSDIKSDSLSFDVLSEGKKEKVVTPNAVKLQYGDNLFTIDLREKLKHKSRYFLKVKDIRGKEFVVPFIYYNPLFVK